MSERAARLAPRCDQLRDRRRDRSGAPAERRVRMSEGPPHRGSLRGRGRHPTGLGVPVLGAVAKRVDGEQPEKKTKPRTHWDMLMERRTVEDLEEVLAERLEVLRAGGIPWIAGAAQERLTPTFPTAASAHRGRRGRFLVLRGFSEVVVAAVDLAGDDPRIGRIALLSPLRQSDEAPGDHPGNNRRAIGRVNGSTRKNPTMSVRKPSVTSNVPPTSTSPASESSRSGSRPVPAASRSACQVR